MKNITIKVSLLTIIVSLLIALVGCGGNGEFDDPSVKLVRVWVHKSEAEDEGKTYLAIQDNFNNEAFETEDGLKVRMRIEFKNSADSLQTAINAEILAGGLPDIIALDSPNVTAYADADILTNIDDYITEEEKNSYVDSAIDQGTIDDKLYALFGMDAPVGLYYNKEILEQLNITPGSLENPWSWNDLFEAMAQLKSDGLPYKFKANLGFGGDEGAMYLYSPIVYSSGGSFVGNNGKVTGHLNSTASINGLKVIEKIFSIDLTDNEAWMYNGVNTDALASGEVAFELYGPWNITTIKRSYPEFVSKYDIMPTPVYESESGVKGTLANGAGSWGFGVTSASRNVEAATIALKYLTGAEASELLYQTIGTFPTHKSVLENNSDFQSGPLKSLSEILIHATTPRPKLVKYPELSLVFSKIIAYVEATLGTPEYDLKGYVDSQITTVDN